HALLPQPCRHALTLGHDLLRHDHALPQDDALLHDELLLVHRDRDRAVGQRLDLARVVLVRRYPPKPYVLTLPRHIEPFVGGVGPPEPASCGSSRGTPTAWCRAARPAARPEPSRRPGCAAPSCSGR